MLAALALAAGLPLAAMQQPDAAQSATPTELYEAWWEGVAAKPLPALRTGFVLEGSFVSATEQVAEPPNGRMTVRGTLQYRDAAHLRMEGTLQVDFDDGTGGSGSFLVLVAGDRVVLSGGLTERLPGGEQKPREGGTASVSTTKLREAAAASQDVYSKLGLEALGMPPSMFESEVAEWFHPVLLGRYSVESSRVTGFALDQTTASCTLGARVDEMRQAVDAALEFSGVSEMPELMEEMDAQMEGLFRWADSLEFVMAFDRKTGLPRPFSMSLALPTMMLGEGEPPVTVSCSARLVDVDLAPEFVEGTFRYDTEEALLDLDPFVDSAIGAMRVMLEEMQAESDLEF